ncbi:hypothetical protein GZH46_01614 [Fragariocoptes setiger]|uniref:Uncharacterized protein n=1 Tax=Fragariocoptes setiger TaxID=1670756 RepID=A0ABQ7S8Z8_9ACAR|nr:hypothetical protein GZH46_01614 [Fragariocoptes setiger]
MKTSLLLCTTCLLVVSTASAQHYFRFPSLSSALSSLTGFGGNNNQQQNNQNNAQPGQQSGQQQGSASSLYGGLVRDYGRGLMAAMSNIYPTLFKPPQSQVQQLQGQSNMFGGDQTFSSSSPYVQAAQSLSNLYQSATNGAASVANAPSNGPSFTFGGSTFSLSPSLPSLASLAGNSQSGSQSSSPFASLAASYGSSINSPASFGPMSSFLSSAFGAQNGGSPSGPPSGSPSGPHHSGQAFGAPPQYAANSFDASSNGLSLSSPGMQTISGFGNQQQFGSPFSSMPSTGGIGSPTGLHHSQSSLGSLMPASSQSNPINSYAPPSMYQNAQNQMSQGAHQGSFGGFAQSQSDPSSLMGPHGSSSFGSSSGPNAGERRSKTVMMNIEQNSIQMNGDQNSSLVKDAAINNNFPTASMVNYSEPESFQARLNRKNEEIESLMSSLTKVENDLSCKNARIRSLELSLESVSDQVNHFKQIANQYELELKSMKHEVEQKSTLLQEAIDDSLSKDKLIEQMKAKVSELDARFVNEQANSDAITDKENTIKHLQKRCDELARQVEEHIYLLSREQNLRVEQGQKLNELEQERSRLLASQTVSNRVMAPQQPLNQSTTHSHDNSTFLNMSNADYSNDPTNQRLLGIDTSYKQKPQIGGSQLNYLIDDVKLYFRDHIQSSRFCRELMTRFEKIENKQISDSLKIAKNVLRRNSRLVIIGITSSVAEVPSVWIRYTGILIVFSTSIATSTVATVTGWRSIMLLTMPIIATMAVIVMSHTMVSSVAIARQLVLTPAVQPLLQVFRFGL